jgi:hypothetical protein
MLYVFIRTCVRDDYISRLAYESIKNIYPDASYMFLCETGRYVYSTVEPMIYREKCDNFGGQFGVKGLLKNLRSTNITPDDSDNIFIVDSDIVMFDDALSLIDQDTHHAGVLTNTIWDLKHISGQFQIISGFLFKKLISMNLGDIDKIVNEMVSSKIDVADDTFISFISDKLNLKKQYVNTWIHNKFYNYNGDINYSNIIVEIKNKHHHII